jgi:hypothetical protein
VRQEDFWKIDSYVAKVSNVQRGEDLKVWKCSLLSHRNVRHLGIAYSRPCCDLQCTYVLRLVGAYLTQYSQSSEILPRKLSKGLSLINPVMSPELGRVRKQTYLIPPARTFRHATRQPRVSLPRYGTHSGYIGLTNVLPRSSPDVYRVFLSHLYMVVPWYTHSKMPETRTSEPSPTRPRSAVLTSEASGTAVRILNLHKASRHWTFPSSLGSF